MTRSQRCFLFAITVTLLVQACNAAEPEAGLTSVYIQNTSQFDFDEMVFEDWTVGALASGQAAGPRDFDTVYRIAFVRVTVNRKEFILQPIDHVGELPLGEGVFTFVIDLPDLDAETYTGLTIDVREGPP